ncbi:MAG TPA: hypothetical protein VLE51_03640 [Candidatus Saccharimonadales bacterium]|nr:hypothetical protein [Candidatus Saccharimonadales bacterium]
MEASPQFEPWEHLSYEGNQLRRRVLESDDLRLWDFGFIRGLVSIEEGTPRYSVDGITPVIDMGTLPDRLSPSK